MRYYSAQDFPGGSVVQNLSAIAGDSGQGFNFWVGKSPGVGNDSIPAEEIP